MYLANRTRDLLRNNNAETDDREFSDDNMFRER